jgi:hypothetical protein
MRETTRHRDAFNAYVDMGSERTIEKLRSELQERGRAPSVRTLYEWSRTFHWQYRLDDLERKARAAEEDARIEAIREMRERQAKEALLLQQKGAEWISGLADAPSAEAAIRAIVEGAKLERLARGETTEKVEIEQTGNSRLMEMTDDELERLIRIAEGHLGGDSPA